ncbi:MAG: Trehalose/maltose import ATP-binding protein MalK [Candidatus Methanofastidiosum methylothiophilum]|uniref:Trehalose/maltose import ATP-binding protein MalK n=1 Tax=Candidatus Methanofastidiosum methylothiophilum TaxID=1705564 RepID=A0A150IJ18_9EURY|nr:MAG: Trehalose/maltose import ATP-binding protein MalK [Candidatus Methanofastidiosum methylthiophilus]
MKAVEVKNLTKEFVKGKKAVDNISFDINKGEILGFIGPNGAGKSTTIKMLSGILTPTEGSISVLGFNPTKERKKLAKSIGTVFGQKSQLWMHLPPIETFKLLGVLYDVNSKILKERIDKFTELFELKEIINTQVRKLSLGERIKCEIAASLIHNPEVLFLDEPTIGLDVVIKKVIRDLIIKMNQDEQVTILLTSHDIGDIEKLCDRVIIINNGKVVFENSMKFLKYNYLGKKIISVKTENIFALNELEGVTILKQKDYSAKLEVDSRVNSIKDIIDMIVSKNIILDITIDDIPLEEVIGQIYKNNEQ